ncbi:MAG: hypothetical protein WC867_06960 [Candidatus Pacearchaeota archaeon]|jgi:hypothetical protein
MKKDVNVRAQMSLFIIIGIILFILIGLIYGYYGYKLKKDAELNKEYFNNEEIKLEVENIYSNILLCIDISGRESLRMLGLQGGYIKKPIRAIEYDGFFIPYHYYEGESYPLGIEEVKPELELFMNQEVERCFNTLNFSNYELKHDLPKTQVAINNDEIVFNVDSKFTIKRDGRFISFNTNEYPIQQKSALKGILEIDQYILDSHKLDPKKYCISCIDKMAKEKDIYVKYSVFSNNTVLFIIGENRTGTEPYLFNFFNKYTGKETSDDFKLTGDSAEKIPVYQGGIKS